MRSHSVHVNRNPARKLWSTRKSSVDALICRRKRLHEEFKRRIKTQTVLPIAETEAMLFRALLASGQTTIRKVDVWMTLADKPSDQPIDLAP